VSMRSVTDFLLHRTGSTRSVAIARILFALLVWSELGSEFRVVSSLGVPWQLPIATVVWVGTVGMLLGVWSRLSCAVTGLTLLSAWWVLGEQGGDIHFRRHHVYALAMGITMLALTPCGRSFSVDRVLAVRRARAEGAPIPEERGDLWALTLVQLQVAAIYLFAAYDKSDPYFGVHFEQAMRMHLFGAIPLSDATESFLDLCAYASVALEYVLPFTLVWRRTRTLSIVVAVAFHTSIYLLLSVGTFTCTMFVFFLLYIDPATIHRWIDDMVAPERGEGSEPPVEESPAYRAAG